MRASNSKCDICGGPVLERVTVNAPSLHPEPLEFDLCVGHRNRFYFDLGQWVGEQRLRAKNEGGTP